MYVSRGHVHVLFAGRLRAVCMSRVVTFMFMGYAPISGAAHRARRSARCELREREGTRPDRLKAPTLQVPSLAEHAAPLRCALSAPHARSGAVRRRHWPVLRARRRPLLGNSVAPPPLLSRRCGARGRRRVCWRRGLGGRCGDDRRQSVRLRGAGPSQPRRLPRGAPPPPLSGCPDALSPHRSPPPPPPPRAAQPPPPPCPDQAVARSLSGPRRRPARLPRGGPRPSPAPQHPRRPSRPPAPAPRAARPLPSTFEQKSSLPPTPRRNLRATHRLRRPPPPGAPARPGPERCAPRDPPAPPPPTPYCCPYPCPYCTLALSAPPPSLLLPLPMSLLYTPSVDNRALCPARSAVHGSSFDQPRSNRAVRSRAKAARSARHSRVRTFPALRARPGSAAGCR